MASQVNFQDSEIPSERLTEHSNDAPTPEPPPAEAPAPQVNVVRRKRRRRNFAPPVSEYSTPAAVPVYIPQEPEHVVTKHRRRSRRRDKQRNRRRMWRKVLFVSIHVAFILLLIFLWMKVSANVSE
jgi:hypothetical protein